MILRDSKKLKRFFTGYWPQLLIFFVLLFLSTCMTLFFTGSAVKSGWDEFGTIAGGAFFAGYDWSPSLIGTPYYGFGFSILMTPLFLLIEDPAVLYHVLYLLNGAALGTSGVFCYVISKRYLNISKTHTAILVSLASCCFFSVLIHSVTLTNETALFLLLWVMLYLLLKLYENLDNKKRNRIYTVVLAVIISYSFFIHTRVLFYVGGIIITIIYCAIKNKKLLLNIPLFLAICVAGYVITSFAISQVQEGLWHASQSAEMDNTVDNAFAQLSMITEFFTEEGYAGAYFVSSLGRLFSVFAISGSMVAVACVCCVVLIFFSKWLGQQTLPKGEAGPKSTEGGGSSPLQYLQLMAIFIFSIFCAYLLLVNFVTMDRIAAALANGTGEKFMIYLRYHGIAAGPMLLIVFAFYNEKRKNDRRILLVSLAISIGVILCFGLLYGSLFQGVNIGSSGNYLQFLPFTLLGGSGVMSARTILVFGLVGIAFSLATGVLLYRRSVRWAAVLSLAVAVYTFVYVTVAAYIPTSHYMAGLVDESVKIVHRLEADSGGEELPSKIYIVDELRSYAQAMQYMNPRTTVYPLSRMQDNEYVALLSQEEYILFSDRPIQSQDKLVDVSDDYRMVQLDDTEYIYCKGKHWVALLEEMGIVLQPVCYSYENILQLPLRAILDSSQKIPLDQFYTEVGALDEKGFASDGKAGYLLYGPYLTTFAGTVEWTLDMTLLEADKGTDAIGEVGLTYTNKDRKIIVLRTRPLSRTDFTDGEASIVLHVDTDISLPLSECLVFVEAGVVLRIESVELTHRLP